MRAGILRRSLALGLFLVPLVSHAESVRDQDYWRGWCAGRQAGLEYASSVTQAVKTQVSWSLARHQEDAPIKEVFDRFFLAIPLTFGAGMVKYHTLDLPDGRTITCPDGVVTTTVHPEWKG